MQDTATLRAVIRDSSRHALSCGALKSITTEACAIEDGGLRFVVRSVSSRARKSKERVRQAERASAEASRVNPVQPYDSDLFVAELSTQHILLLNKFNVLENHLLVVTRSYEDQETLLTAADFEALRVCLDAIDGLGFYNGGRMAGASQPHKHIQLVPVPIAPTSADAGDDSPIPLEPLIAAAGEATAVDSLPFHNALAVFDPEPSGSSPPAETLNACYRGLLRATGIAAAEHGSRRQALPYNLLVTRRWMLAVPRSAERYRGISVNALGYAGSLFVRNAEQMRTLLQVGPMAVLASLGRPRQAA